MDTDPRTVCISLRAVLHVTDMSLTYEGPRFLSLIRPSLVISGFKL